MESAPRKRVSSPTNPTFSGISSPSDGHHRTDFHADCKPLRDKSPVSYPGPPVDDAYQVSRTHYDELRNFLVSYLAKGKALCPLLVSFHHLPRRLTGIAFLVSEPVNSPRQNLTKVTRQQFQELSTDVCDELMRRKSHSDNNQGLVFSPFLTVSSYRPALVPFLPAREGFHPKRNQARQNLATLSTNRFRDLSSDVYYELVRRYPEFKEEVGLILSPLHSPNLHPPPLAAFR